MEWGIKNIHLCEEGLMLQKQERIILRVDTKNPLSYFYAGML